MSMKLLGPSFDLHLGGEDLMFPHHEDEIAQSEGAGVQPAGQHFVKYWLHGAHLLVEGKKMSKSLGNFFTLRDLLAKGFTGREIRYLLLTAHYRETFNFTLEGLQGARAALARIDECLETLHRVADGTVADPKEVWQDSLNAELRKRFEEALDSDLNVSVAWATVHHWIRNHGPAESLLSSKLDAARALAAWRRIDEVLGLGDRPAEQIPSDIAVWADEREQCRKAKDFKRADAIRKLVQDKGWIIEDTPQGPKIKRLLK
jgi:cysteinyl-tRNA synthetase